MCREVAYFNNHAAGLDEDALTILEIFALYEIQEKLLELLRFLSHHSCCFQSNTLQ